METKSSIRKRILSVRNEMSSDLRVKYSKQIKDRLLGMPVLTEVENVLCFAGYQSEVQTEELIEELLDRGKKVYLPRVDGEDMEFYRITDILDLTEGYKGIPEPNGDCTENFRFYENADVIMIMPGCVFAKDGSRIGYGKGFYDRYLGKCDIMNRIALCFSAQIVDDIPNDIHDKKASIIVTEDEIIECRKVLLQDGI